MTDEDELARIRRQSDELAAAESNGDGAAPEPEAPGPPNPLTLMLGSSFNPQPFTYVVTPGQVGEARGFYLVIETALGRVAVFMSSAECQRMAQELWEKTTGLTVPGKPGIILPGQN